MKFPNELETTELRKLITEIQREVFFESDEHGGGAWNYAKPHDYRDLLQHIAELLQQYGLAPEFAENV